MKGQTAVEYMMLVGFVIAALFLISTYVYRQNETETRSIQAQIAADSITKAADNIYAQGPGAKTSINIYFPVGYTPQQSKLNGKGILLKIFTPVGYTDIIAFSKANLTGSLPTSSGYKSLTLELVDGNVNITSS